MRESSKTNAFREPRFFADYLGGTVLDIGCGPDPVVPHAQPFDRIHGDAERITDFVSTSYDTVHSSHCLEHMADVPRALAGWWQLVRPGGYLVVVVPHEDLYEQGFWPSLYNRDHKASFRLDTDGSWSPISYDLRKLVQGLPGAEIVSLRVQDQGYRLDWRPAVGGRPRRLGGLGRFASRLRHSLLKRSRDRDALAGRLNPLLARWGVPIDQTHTGALAQIECVARKRSAER
jgi:SAM-dependent methyltransferase